MVVCSASRRSPMRRLSLGRCFWACLLLYGCSSDAGGGNAAAFGADTGTGGGTSMSTAGVTNRAGGNAGGNAGSRTSGGGTSSIEETSTVGGSGFGGNPPQGGTGAGVGSAGIGGQLNRGGQGTAGVAQGGFTAGGGIGQGGTLATGGQGVAGTNGGSSAGGWPGSGGWPLGNGGALGSGGVHDGQGGNEAPDPTAGGMSAGSAGAGDAGTGNAGAGGASTDCPASGNITYTLRREDNPTADELDAYERITAAMDEAIWYYNCYTNIEKPLTVNYKPGVRTAEANIDGWMSFGSDRAYMVLSTAMHEVSHTVGIGYYSFNDMLDGDVWTGPIANAKLDELQAEIVNPEFTDVHGGGQHFWPYGLNYADEYESETDLINHCLMVVAIRADMGM